MPRAILKGTDFFKIGIRMMALSYVVLLAISVLYWPFLTALRFT
jgi:solute carrier family 13 (sodium-dependent dicarboxylate transporter), member 2/3/5